MKKYKVTCQKCGESDVLTFDEDNHRLMHNDKIMLSPIISVRWRGDMTWGYECKCGNYDLLAQEEIKDFDKLVTGSPMRVAEIANILKQKNKLRFNVEGA